MNKKDSGFYILILFFSFSFISIQETNNLDNQVPKIILEYRELKPGEIVKVTLQNENNVKLAHIKFSGKKIAMTRIIDGEEFQAIIGLDMAIKPDTYSISVLVLFNDGKQITIKKNFSVETKEFPVKRLWVNEKFVTPPQEVLERISRESVLTRAVYEIYSPHWMGDGSFIVPLAGKVTPNFGEKRFFNDQPRSSHSGIDISSPTGTPIKASNSGKIVLANNLYFAGKAVIINHGLGIFSFYCHLSKINVQIGGKVKKGQVIGEVGATGRVTGPHLHWSIKIMGSRVDPFSLLSLKLN